MLRANKTDAGQQRKNRAHPAIRPDCPLSRHADRQLMVHLRLNLNLWTLVVQDLRLTGSQFAMWVSRGTHTETRCVRIDDTIARHNGDRANRHISMSIWHTATPQDATKNRVRKSLNRRLPRPFAAANRAGKAGRTALAVAYGAMSRTIPVKIRS